MYPVKIRIGGSHARNPETKEYEDSTFEAAVAATRGKHDGTSYHDGTYVYVAATYPEDVTEEERQIGGVVKQVKHEKGEPIFGFEVTVNPIEARWGTGSVRPAQVNWPSIGASVPEDAMLFAHLIRVAAHIAEAANQGPDCAKCVADFEEYQAERAARRTAKEAG